ncbi:hypothetical protein E1B28_000768 [Marasmius oreades]|nr:uncharacterized protein E1B28_000768 [Marasmius oreades]KAG7098867.1 hypothetical protein E1B28_000768 [Marasmius oreades]
MAMACGFRCLPSSGAIRSLDGIELHRIKPRAPFSLRSPMERFPRQLVLNNSDAQIFSPGLSASPGSAFLIPFILEVAQPSSEASILTFLQLHDPHLVSCSYVRCAWFFVALFSILREEMVRWGRHGNYIALSEAWRDFLSSRRQRIYEQVVVRSVELVETDLCRADITKSPSRKDAQAAAEALILQICRMTGERPSSRGKVQLLLLFDDASVLEASEYTIIVTSHLFIHLPVMFLHISPPWKGGPSERTEEDVKDLGHYLSAEALVPLPLDMPLDIRTNHLWEFLSGRMIWNGIHYDSVSILHARVPPKHGEQTVARSKATEPTILDDGEANPFRMIIDSREESIIDKIGGSTRVDCEVVEFPSTPTRLLDFLEMIFGAEQMSQLSKSTVTELPMFGYVFRNAWVHFTHVVRPDDNQEQQMMSLGSKLESALSQQAALVDSWRRMLIPVFSGSSAQAVRREIATSAVVISFGDVNNELELESLPDLLPQLFIQLHEGLGSAIRVETRRTSSNGAFGYQITA